MAPGWKRPDPGPDDGLEPWGDPDLTLPDDDPPASDLDDEDEWTEEDERRYQARREEERLRAQRRRRQAVAFGVAVLVVLGLGVAAAGVTAGWWSWPSSSDGDADAGADTCPTPTPIAAAPTEVTVVVLNATGRRGLAGDVASALQARGFVVREIGNDTGGPVAEAGQVRHGPEGLLSARAVGAQVPGAVLVDDGRAGSVVDLSLGDGFAALATPEEAAAATAPITPEQPSGCVPAD